MAFAHEYHDTPAESAELESEFLGWHSPVSLNQLNDAQQFAPVMSNAVAASRSVYRGSCGDECPYAKLILSILEERNQHAHDDAREGSNPLPPHLAGHNGRYTWNKTKSFLGNVKRALSMKSLGRSLRPNSRKPRSRGGSYASSPSDESSPVASTAQSQDELAPQELESPIEIQELRGSDEIAVSNAETSPQYTHFAPNNFNDPPVSANFSWIPSNPSAPVELPGQPILCELPQETYSTLPSTSRFSPRLRGPKLGMPMASWSTVSEMSFSEASASSISDFVSPQSTFVESRGASLQSIPTTISTGSQLCEEQIPFCESPVDMEDGMGDAKFPAWGPPASKTHSWHSATTGTLEESLSSPAPLMRAALSWDGHTTARHQESSASSSTQQWQMQGINFFAQPIVALEPGRLELNDNSPKQSPHHDPERSLPIHSLAKRKSSSQLNSLKRTFWSIVQTFGDGDIIDVIRGASFVDVILQPGIEELENIVKGIPFSGGAIRQHCFVYLVLAMAKELKEKLPTSVHSRLEDLSSFISTGVKTLPTGILLAVSDYFLAGLEAHLKFDLKHQHPVKCHCTPARTMTISSLSPLFQRFPFLELSEVTAALISHRWLSARDVELKLITLPRLVAPSLISPRTFFEEYLPSVRNICNAYYCPCYGREEHHLWTISFMKDYFAHWSEDQTGKLLQTAPSEISPDSTPLTMPSDSAASDTSTPSTAFDSEDEVGESPAAVLQDTPERRCCVPCKKVFGTGPDRNKKYNRHLESKGHRITCGLEAGQQLFCSFTNQDGTICPKVKGYNRKDKFQRHVRDDHGRFLCVFELEDKSLCLQDFDSKEVLEQHENGVHKARKRRTVTDEGILSAGQYGHVVPRPPPSKRRKIEQKSGSTKKA